MKIKTYIFNYCRYFDSFKLFEEFKKRNIESKIIDCQCDKIEKLEFLNFSRDSFINLPNVGYSGQWNAMLDDLDDDEEDYDVILIVNSDVSIPKLDFLLERMDKFYSMENSGIYAPHVRWCGWNFCRKMLPKIEDFHVVSATDSVIWSLRKEIAFKVGKIDLEVNKLGWGIEVLASYFSKLKNQHVVRDYKVFCRHPKSTSYGRQEAGLQQEKWFNSFDFSEDLWKHYETRYKYGFNKSGLLMG